MKEIIVTAVGGDIGYGIVKALKNSGRALRITGCDIRPHNMSTDLLDEFFLCPPYTETERWTEAMREMIAKHQADYFFPVTEPEIAIVHGARDLFSSVTTVINQPEVLDIALDKGKTAAFLGEKGVPTPKTWLSMPEETPAFPLVVKEAAGCGSHSVITVSTEEELTQACRRMERPVIQACIGVPEEEYTLTVFSDGRTVNHIAFRRELGFGGMSRYVELVRDETLSALAEKIAEVFHLRGSVNVQCRKQDGEYFVFEINPRISSTLGFRVPLGFHDVLWWLDSLEGIPVPRYTAPEGPVFGVRTVEEKLFR